MSKEYPCIYYRENGFCSYGGDLSEANICVMGPCQHEKQSNADRIRSMSDEELAELLTDGCRGSKCSEAPKNKYGSVNCFQCRLNWLIKSAND